MTDYPWMELLSQWSSKILASDNYHPSLPTGVIDSGWLGFKGATETRIAKAEARLNTALPPSYRGFLNASNGWRMTGPFIHKLWSTEKIEWHAIRHPDLVEGWAYGEQFAKQMDGEGRPIAGQYYSGSFEASEDTWVSSEQLKRTLEVSDYGDAAIYLLNPQVVQPDGEWEAWMFATWIPGAIKYRSFWDLMQAEYEHFQQLEGSKPELLAELGQKIQAYISLATRQEENLLQSSMHLSTAEGLQYAARRVREIQSQGLSPEQSLAELLVLTEDLEARWQQGVQSAKQSYDIKRLLSGNVGQMIGQVRAASLSEGYRQAAGIIRWSLNNDPPSSQQASPPPNRAPV